jgi:Sulfotransferase domain
VINMKGISWLASYPKSGNTWFRYFLLNLLENSDQPVDINHMEHITVASSRSLFDETVGIESSDLTGEEIDNLRPKVYRHIANHSENNCFFKIHDAYTYVAKDTPLVPPEITDRVIYFIRNPLDVAVSFANHLGTSTAEAVKMMNDDSACLCGEPGLVHQQLPQKLLSWSQHVCSWTEAEKLNLHVVRFEDMKEHTVETFKRAISFLGLKVNPSRFKQALATSDFSLMQAKEQESGFCEKHPNCKTFFRKGQTGTWRGVLTDNEVKDIVGNNKATMKAFGYLNENDEPLY